MDFWHDAAAHKRWLRRFALPTGVLTAMRHIAYVDFEKLYNFSLPEDALKILNAATESYVVHTLHTVPKTLEFYKTFLV